jgi:hypothetical protein
MKEGKNVKPTVELKRFGGIKRLLSKLVSINELTPPFVEWFKYEI